MAHQISPEVFNPGFESRPVTTETGTSVSDFTAEDVAFALHLLAYNNTRFDKTSTQLEKDYGLSIHSITLRRWVSSLFTQKYVEIQHQLEQQINDKLSAKVVDLAAKAAQAQDEALDMGLQSIGNLKPHEVSSAVKNYADAAQKNVQQAQLIQDKPTSIVKHQTVDDALKVLEELGLMTDAEVVEEEEE
jgi:hypothetical protein